jgi:tRNA threonylcarbamoyladenosine biosynthesis protein TsaB
MITVLGIDSAGASASAAVLRGGDVLAARAQRMERGQAEILVPLIAQVLEEARLEVAALDLIGVSVGPGSFTGLRIGIAAARGLALASGVPALGVSSFAAIAARVPPSLRAGRALLVALDTRREDFYLQLFAASGEATEPRLAGGEAVADGLPDAPLLVAGDASARLMPFLAEREVAIAPDTDHARAEDVARLAADAYRPDAAAAPPRPVYLRAPDTTAPRQSA